MRSVSAWVLGLCGVVMVAVLASAGCKKAAQEPAPKSAGEASAAARVPAKTEGVSLPTEKAVLSGLSQLAYLPKSTVFVAAVDGLAPWAERLGYAAIAAKHRALIDSMGADLKRAVGADLTKLKAFSTVGLDIHKPISVALWTQPAYAAGFVVPVSDSVKATALVRALAAVERMTLTEKPGAAGPILFDTNYHDLAVLVRKDALVVVLAKDAVAAATALQDLKPADSLGARATFGKALAGLGFGAQAAALIDINALVGYSAVVMGAGWSDDAAKIGARAQAMADEFVGKGALMTLGARVTPEGLTVSGALTLAKTSPFRKLFTAPAAVPAIVRVTAKSPLFLTHFHFDPKGLYRALRKAATRSGAPMDQIASMAKEVAGIDLETLDTLLTGEVGFAVTGGIEGIWDQDLSDDAVRKRVEESVGGTALVGLKDEAKIKALLKTLTAMLPAEIAELITEKDGAWTIKVPVIKPITVQVKDGFLAASTDKAALAALAKGDRGMASHLRPALAKQLMGASGGVVLAATDLGLVGPWFVLAQHNAMGDREHFDKPFEDAAMEKRRQDYREKLKAFKALQKADEAIQQTHFRAIMRPLSLLVGQASAVPTGFRGTAGLFLKGTTAKAWTLALVDAMVDAEGPRRARRDAIWKLEEQVSNLFVSLQQAPH